MKITNARQFPISVNYKPKTNSPAAHSQSNESFSLSGFSNYDGMKSRMLTSTLNFGATAAETNGRKHTSAFFREDISWKKFAEFIGKNFKEPTRIIFEAGSDGSEAYALALALISQLGEKKAQRFFPIRVRDIDSEIIEKAQKGIIGISGYEHMQLEGQFSNMDIDMFFKKMDESEYPVEHSDEENTDFYPYEVSPDLRKYVVFEESNLLDDSSDEYDRKNIILVRNVAHQIPKNQYKNVLDNYHKNLQPGSLFVVGMVEQLTGPHYCDEELKKRFGLVPEANKSRLGYTVYNSVYTQH